MILGHLRNMSPSNKRLALQIVLISLLCIMSILIHKTTCSSELIIFIILDDCRIVQRNFL